MNKTIQINLNGKQHSVDKAIKQLEKYKKELVQTKIDRFVRRLIELGINVSYQNTGKYAGYIVFRKQLVNITNSSVEYLYVAKKTKDLYVEWDGGGYNIDPLLMAEFGSGWNAYDVWGVPNVGQGTHPQQKHALDPKGWWWTDDSGVHHSYGQNPTFPVHKAWIEMKQNIDTVAKEVFK